MAVLLIVAGHETTVSLIASSVLTLLTHRDELEHVLSDPEALPKAIEELLRFESPVERALTRWAATDVELGGHTIRRGELVVAVLGAANRDPARFAEAESLDVGRSDLQHVGFGRGSHYCLGAPLARIETEIALRTLFDRLPTLRLAIDAAGSHGGRSRSSAASSRCPSPGTDHSGAGVTSRVSPRPRGRRRPRHPRRATRSVPPRSRRRPGPGR